MPLRLFGPPCRSAKIQKQKKTRADRLLKRGVWSENPSAMKLQAEVEKAQREKQEARRMVEENTRRRQFRGAPPPPLGPPALFKSHTKRQVQIPTKSGYFLKSVLLNGEMSTPGIT